MLAMRTTRRTKHAPSNVLFVRNGQEITQTEAQKALLAGQAHIDEASTNEVVLLSDGPSPAWTRQANRNFANLVEHERLNP